MNLDDMIKRAIELGPPDHLLTENQKMKKIYPGYLIVGFQGSPAKTSGYECCPTSIVKGKPLDCRKFCINGAGNGRFDNTQIGRIRRSRFFHEDRKAFGLVLDLDLTIWNAKAKALGLVLAFRSNVFTDLNFAKIFGEVFDKHRENGVVFYDYTKAPIRMGRKREWKGDHITYSDHEGLSDSERVAILKSQRNLAVIFFGKKMPETYLGFEVIDGDKNDARFKDRKGIVVGLLAKVAKNPNGEWHGKPKEAR